MQDSEAGSELTEVTFGQVGDEARAASFLSWPIGGRLALARRGGVDGFGGAVDAWFGAEFAAGIVGRCAGALCAAGDEFVAWARLFAPIERAVSTGQFRSAGLSGFFGGGAGNRRRQFGDNGAAANGAGNQHRDINFPDGERGKFIARDAIGRAEFGFGLSVSTLVERARHDGNIDHVLPECFVLAVRASSARR